MAILRRLTRHAMVGAACLVAVAAGCTRSQLPLLAKSSGLVLLDGEPIGGVEVRFVPDTSKSPDGRMATGSTDTDGNFVLSCFADGDGALIGHHRVAIVPKAGIVITGPTDRPVERVVPAAPIPRRYADERTSGLTAEVKAQSPNRFRFEISSKTSKRRP